MEKMPIAEESALDTLSPDKKNALDYALNFDGNGLDTLTGALSWATEEGDTAMIEGINTLLAQFETAAKEDERMVAHEISKLIG